jgi:hypothetical protein
MDGRHRRSFTDDRAGLRRPDLHDRRRLHDHRRHLVDPAAIEIGQRAAAPAAQLIA